MLVGPVSHVTCDLETQRRIQEGHRDAAIRAALGTPRRTLRDRLLRRPGSAVAIDAAALRPAGEDLLHALRY